jgi:hypothetical protein
MLAKALQGAALATIPAYIEDTFATYLYTGNGSTQTITNGIDLSGKGGFVWLKRRDAVDSHALYDTMRGVNKQLVSNTTAAESTTDRLPAFNSTGFNVASGMNTNAATYASWTFRKQAKFFDVVTYTGNGATGRSIPHSLNSVPGCIIVKETSVAGDNWIVWHRSMASNSYLYLNTTAGSMNANTHFGTHTSTNFVVGGTFNETNQSGSGYVAYLFAHDAGGFGAAGTDNVISCGSFTGAVTVSLGYEPQWVLMKATSTTGNWMLVDNMRGLPVSGNPQELVPNTSAAETSNGSININSTGFVSNLSAGVTYIYIAIRRGPMRTPTSGTSVFTPLAVTASTGTSRTIGFPADFIYSKYRDGSDSVVTDKLRGFLNANSINSPSLFTNTTGAENASNYPLAYNVWNTTALDGGYMNSVAAVFYYFRRAPGFFDVVCYTGTGTSTAFNHNLTVVPEMIITKIRNSGVPNWGVWHNALSPSSAMLFLNTTGTQGNGYVNTVTSTTFSFATANGVVNSSGNTYIAYLFATVAGVSKVGSYQGNGTSKTIDCGFTAGARFVMIKRTDSTGDWYVWDTARGIVSGNDPRISMNSTAAEVTTDDTVDPDNSGFIVNQVAATNVNVNNATYIFLAIA